MSTSVSFPQSSAIRGRETRPLRSDVEFIRALTSRQRAYFLARERRHQTRLQDALRELSRGFSAVNELNVEAFALVTTLAGEGSSGVQRADAPRGAIVIPPHTRSRGKVR